MRTLKTKKADLKAYYTLFLETGLIITLVIFLVATKIEFKASSQELQLNETRESIKMEEIINTKQEIKPPSIPRPAVPVAVPNDEVIGDEIINIDAELNFDEALEIPEPPKMKAQEKETPENDFFVMVEHMPELIGGLEGLHEHIQYPIAAKRAGIEGRVMIQFIITETGEIENPVILRGIGGGCDKEALRVITEYARFKPGMQRGVPVRVRFAIPIVFKLMDA